MAKKHTDLFQQLAPWFERHKRAAWKPIVKRAGGSIAASKFAGIPWLAAGERWPDCGNCNVPMRLFVQLNLGTLPKELDGRFGSGLLQLFVCIKEDCLYMKAYGDPFSKCLLARIVQPDNRAKPTKAPSFDDQFEGQFPAKLITGWKKVDDFPSSQDFPELGLEFPDESLQQVGSQLVGRLQCKELGFSAEIPADDFYPLDKCIAGEKLAGWPDWVQVHTSYPSCPRCKKRMDTIVFQVGSEDNIPFMFADGGQGPITQCPVHKDILGFSWDSG